MKNVIIGILFLCTVVSGYFLVKNNFRPLRDKGETAKVVRGDLTLPISATGELKPHRRIIIKSEASGEVVEIPYEGGTRVKAGDLLIRLDRSDEERNRDRAQQDVNVAQAGLTDSQVALDMANGPEIADAKARIDQLQANLEQALYNKEKLESVAPDMKDDAEINFRETTHRGAQAQLDSALAAKARAELMIPRAEQTIERAKAALEIARANLADAERRLSETDITAPLDGILAQVRTQVGEVIQGGKFTSFGGTELGVFLDMSKIIVRAEVDEADIGKVLEITPPWAQPSHDADIEGPADFEAAAATMQRLPKVRVEAFRNEEFTGVIERVFPEPKTINSVVTYQVDVVIVGPNKGKLLPGMRADVTFTSEHIESVLLCPNEAVREGPNGALGVMVPPADRDNPEATPVFVACAVGLSNGSFSEIKTGLKEGDEVYTKLPRADSRKKKD